MDYSASSPASYGFSFNSFNEWEDNTGKPPLVSRPVRKKQHVAPPPPGRPKIYKVDPVDFRDVVQKLTGAPEFQPTGQQEVAPPPHSLSQPRHTPAGYSNAEVPLPDKFVWY